MLKRTSMACTMAAWMAAPAWAKTVHGQLMLLVPLSNAPGRTTLALATFDLVGATS